MSELPNAFDVSKFKEKISLSTNHCLNYVKKECIAGDQTRFTVNIPNEHLKSWYDLKEDGGLDSQFSYAEILNASIVENGVKIRQDCTRINRLIRRSYGNVKNECSQPQGFILWVLFKEILDVDAVEILSKCFNLFRNETWN